MLYNDYDMVDPAKAEFVIRMVKEMRDAGVPVHGVGFQGHWALDWPELAEVDLLLERFQTAGIRVSISELDITVLPAAYEHTGADISQRVEFAEQFDPYREGAPPELLAQQAARYRDCFDLFLKHRGNIDRVTFWGLSDADSWKNDFPMLGRTDYPLLFDRGLQPKPAFMTLMKPVPSE